MGDFKFTISFLKKFFKIFLLNIIKWCGIFLLLQSLSSDPQNHCPGLWNPNWLTCGTMWSEELNE